LHAVRIVTFNFDRVIQTRLFAMLAAGFGMSDDHAGEIVARLRILHVNGSLGRLPWQSAAAGDTSVDFGHRERSAVEAAAEAIQFVHEPRARDEVAEAKRVVASASLVCFIGFGFHPANMDALGLVPGSRIPICKATGFGLTLSETAEIEGQFGGQLQVYGGSDALFFLRNLPELHGYENSGSFGPGWNRERFNEVQRLMRGDGRG
jgi:hypothetical protein